ncbi:MAG: YchF family ATPase [Phycisphaerae bacterium]|nr:YchF family ATPase [Phycisphaerae bacterium]
MKVALIGLLQSGKSTLLAAVSGKAIAQGGPVGMDEAIVPVPDARIDWLSGHYKPKKTTYATLDCLDVPGLDFENDHGRAAARRLVSQIRTVDMLVLVIRAFGDATVPMYRSRVDPIKDLAELHTELLLADLELVTTRIEKLEKQVLRPTPTQAHDRVELALQRKLQQAIESERPISSVIETEAEREMIKSLAFLTEKPMAVAVNVDEGQLDRAFDFSGSLDPSVPVVSISAKLEYELSQLDPASRADFMAEMGIKASGVSQFVNSCYTALGLVSFLTVGSDEVRAWPIRKGTVAVDAAGKVHSDIKRGFIRAEIFGFEDIQAHGSEKELRAAGRFRLEGRDYVVRDGDVINFRFNV